MSKVVIDLSMSVDEIPDGSSTITFVTEGVEEALRQAKAAAGARTVNVGGASAPRQCLAAGLADEIRLHVVPVLLGHGIRFLGEGDLESVSLGPPRVVEAPQDTHLVYPVVH